MGVSGVVGAVGAVGRVCRCVESASVVSDMICAMTCRLFVIQSLLPSCDALARVVLMEVVLRWVR